MTRLRLAQAALDDLRDIRAYSKAAFGPVVARDYLMGLRAVFARLRERPFSGAAEVDLGRGIRGLAYRSHRVYYRVDPDLLVVVRILHHARDARRVLSETE